MAADISAMGAGEIRLKGFRVEQDSEALAQVIALGAGGMQCRSMISRPTLWLSEISCCRKITSWWGLDIRPGGGNSEITYGAHAASRGDPGARS